MFPYCEVKPFWRTIVTTAPFLLLNIFRFQKDLEHRKVPLRKVSVLWDQKSRRRIVMPTQFLFPIIFPKNNFWNTEGFLYEMFRYWETNIFEAQSWSPDPFFLQHFLHLENYLKHRMVPLRTVLVLWNKIVLRRIVMPTHFLFLNIFRHKKVSETQNDSSTKCLGFARQKLSTENRETPPHPMHEKFRL